MKTLPRLYNSGCAHPGGEWCWLWQKLRSTWRLQSFAVVGLCGTSLLWLADPLIVKWIIDDVIPGKNLKMLGLAMALLITAYLCRVLLLTSSLYVSSRAGQVLVFRLRRELFAKVQGCSCDFHEAHDVGGLAYQLEQDVDQVGALGAEIIPNLMRITLTAGLTTVMMFNLSWWLTGSVILFIPVFLISGVIFRRILQRAASRSREAAARRNSFLIESITGAIQIQLLGALRPIRRRYMKVVISAVRANLSERKSQLTYSFVSLFTVAFATTVMLGFGGIGVVKGSLSVGSYVAFYSYLLRLFEPMSSAIEMHARLQRGKVNVRKLMDLDSLEPQMSGAFMAAKTTPGAVDEISCEEVSFGYADNRQILAGANLFLRKGELVAIVGQSGSGKSTLTKLITRLHDVSEGSIRVNGIDIRGLNINGLRMLIGIVPQDPILFEGTIRENLVLGKQGAAQWEIERAIHVACLDDVLKKVPGGLDYRLGQFGSGLSGGEKQRLALARVIIQERPVLILDEATSALDDEVRSRLLDRVSKVSTNKIALIIGHDSVISQWAERVVEVRSGQCFTSEHSGASLIQRVATQ
jgi:ABC-type bacteriocin/lantibiotic exporter with double-glycine peptidase domain